MAEAESYQKLIDDQPAEALKYAKEFEALTFWRYYSSRMQKELNECDAKLRTCAIEEVFTVRGYRKAIEYMLDFPKRMMHDLEEEIFLKKEAAKIEAARQPKEPGK